MKGKGCTNGNPQQKYIKNEQAFISTDISIDVSIQSSLRESQLSGVLWASLQDAFLRHLHKGVYSVVSLQPSLPMSLQDDVLRHLYRDVSTIMSLQSSLLASLRSGFLQSSLLASLWNIFLQRLNGGISTVISIPSKPQIFQQRIRESTIFSIQEKPERPTFWLLLYVSLHISVLHFYKYIGHYVIN